jgi:hypothetical protein
MPSHFHITCTGFYGVRPVRYQFDRLSEVVKGPFGEVSAAQRSVQMAPNFAYM